MLIIKEYDKQTLTEEAFYESSNVFYSKCNDNKNDLKSIKPWLIDDTKNNI